MMHGYHNIGPEKHKTVLFLDSLQSRQAGQKKKHLLYTQQMFAFNLTTFFHTHLQASSAESSTEFKKLIQQLLSGRIGKQLKDLQIFKNITWFIGLTNTCTCSLPSCLQSITAQRRFHFEKSLGTLRSLSFNFRQILLIHFLSLKHQMKSTPSVAESYKLALMAFKSWIYANKDFSKQTFY